VMRVFVSGRKRTIIRLSLVFPGWFPMTLYEMTFMIRGQAHEFWPFAIRHHGLSLTAAHAE
jgi:hypothetical protein